MANRTWILGSGAGCDLTLDRPGVAARHCQLQRSETGFIVADLGSESRTYVNGTAISGPVPVSPDDKVTLGPSETLPWPVFLDAQPDRIVRIGRSSHNDVVLADPVVSGSHARLLLYDRCAILEDVGSRNGTAVGERGRWVKQAVISRDDVVYLGTFEIPASQLYPQLPPARPDGLGPAEPEAPQPAGPDGPAPAELEPPRAAEPGPPAPAKPRVPTQRLGEKEDDFDRLRRQLVELGLITRADWEAAAAEIGDSRDPAAMVNVLRTRDSSRPGPDGQPTPLLTDYQAEVILKEGHPVEDVGLGHYVIRRRLGSGGMGQVLEAYDRVRGRYAAVKVVTGLARRSAEPPASYDLDSWRKAEYEAADIDTLRRFDREARLLAELSHPGFAAYYESGDHHGMPFIAMELLVGETLEDIVRRGREQGERAPVDWVIDAALILADALEHAHRHPAKIIHRDIKPSNIMVTQSGQLKILDLGIARLADAGGAVNSASLQAHVTQGGVGLGTPEFMSPEQWRDAASVTPATDVYGLGCTLFFLLAGRPPYAGSLPELLRSHLSGPPPPVRKYRTDVPKWFEAVLLRMMATRPEDRYPSASELKRDLQRRRDGGTRPWRVVTASIAGAIAIAVLYGLYRWLFVK